VLWPEPDLPRTSTGKVRRKAVAAWLAGIQAAAAAPSNGSGTHSRAERLWGLVGLAAGAHCADHRRSLIPAWAMSCA
jgi:hypothetical protein